MFLKNYRCSIAVLFLAGLLIPAAQAFASGPQTPVTGQKFICNYWFNNGVTGRYESEFIPPSWTARGVPPPNKLWGGLVKRFFFNPNDPANPIVNEARVDIAYKPHELPPGALEYTLPDEGKQCKNFRIEYMEFAPGLCREVITFRNCVGGGLEDLDLQRCVEEHAWPCGPGGKPPDRP